MQCPSLRRWTAYSFNALVEDTLGEDCSYDTVLNIHEKLNDLIEAQKDEPEPVVLTKSEVKRLFEECGVEDEKLQSFDEQYEITAGEKSFWLLLILPIHEDSRLRLLMLSFSRP